MEKRWRNGHQRQRFDARSVSRCVKSGYDPDSATVLLALPGHHINRVVQKYAADLGRGFGHENARGWKASH